MASTLDPPDLSRLACPRLERQFVHVAQAAGFGLIALGTLVLIGWALDVPVLKSITPGLASMKPNTALQFVLVGGALVCAGRPGWERGRAALGLLVAFGGALVLVEYAFAVDLRVDQALFVDRASTTTPGRMSEVTAANFVFVGLALAVLDVAGRPRPSHLLVMPAGVIALVALCGYLYGAQSMYAIGPFGTVAVHTAAAFAVAVMATLAARPGVGVMAVVASDTSAGSFLRRIGPALVLVPAVLGWLHQRGLRAGLYDPSFGMAVAVAATMVALGTLAWSTALSLGRVELDRGRVTRDLRRLNEELESRVASRTAELGATLAERTILLQEVHHRVKNNLQVVSSLLNLQARQLPAGGGREQLRQCQQRVRTIALMHEQLYRSATFRGVSFGAYARSLAQSVVETTGLPPERVRLDLLIGDDEIPAEQAISCGLILNELLSNAAKHAFPDGRSGRVTVRVTHGTEIELSVEDDGVGLPDGFDPEHPSSLGTRIVRVLAEQLEGVATFERDAGTRVRIRFPVPVAA